MRKFLLATSSLAATAGFASAQDAPPEGVFITGTASMGVLGGDWITDYDGTGALYPGQGEYEFHTDIDVTFSMIGQSDTGLIFGAQIDLDESDGFGNRGNSLAFENRSEGGESIFVSGPFGLLTMGDTDGALDWALQEIGIGRSLGGAVIGNLSGDAHTAHLGYSSHNFADYEDGSGQIARYEYAFGDFAVALSADIADEDGKDILSAGASYLAELNGTRLVAGLGYQQRGHDRKDNDAVGVSLSASMANGFLAVLNWVDMGDSLMGTETEPERKVNGLSEQFVGIGLGYRMNDWLFSANYGRITEKGTTGGLTYDRGQDGYGLAASYDLGGGAQVQLGYSKSGCKATNRVAFPGSTTNEMADIGGAVTQDAETLCGRFDREFSAFSLGVAMQF